MYSKIVPKSIEGDFLHGQIVDGHAIETWNNGESYEGNFINLKKEGDFKHNDRNLVFAELTFKDNKPIPFNVELKVKAAHDELFNGEELKIDKLAKFFSEPSPPFGDEKQTVELVYMGNVRIEIVNDKTTYRLLLGEISIFGFYRVRGQWRNDVPNGNFTIEDIKDRKTIHMEFIDGVEKSRKMKTWDNPTETEEGVEIYTAK